LTLIQRDRNAAWFAEPDGARVLICSEIGGEGRNFQFAHHLMMFDLPRDPELLEQRIGRLDRIGQTQEIHVHVPFGAGSPAEVLVLWYADGVDTFRHNLSGGRELWEQFGSRLESLAGRVTGEPGLDLFREMAPLLEETRRVRRQLALRLEQGRDRLLELNSFRADAAQEVLQAIQAQDGLGELDTWMLAIWDEYALSVEELAPRVYRLGSAGVFAESFPGLPQGGFTVTTDRRHALAREEIQFLTWDHPLVTGALDLLLGSERGNCSFAKWVDAQVSCLYLEVLYVLECLAPSQLHIDRFLPPTPIRVVVDHQGKDFTDDLSPEKLSRVVRPAEVYPLSQATGFREELLPRMRAQADELAGGQVPRLIEQARREMAQQLGQELDRLRSLRQVNRSVRAEEIVALERQITEMSGLLVSSRLRVDALRFIQRGRT